MQQEFDDNIHSVPGKDGSHYRQVPFPLSEKFSFRHQFFMYRSNNWDLKDQVCNFEIDCMTQSMTLFHTQVEPHGLVGSNFLSCWIFVPNSTIPFCLNTIYIKLQTNSGKSFAPNFQNTLLQLSIRFFYGRQQLLQFESMQRRQKGIKKHPPTTRPSPVLHQFADKDLYYFENKPASEDIREQLRATLEELEHNRLTSDLQVQKRLLLQQQLRNSQQQNDEQHAEIQQLRKELSKLSKKYGKMKEKKACDKCKGHEDLSSQLEKQRQIYANDRKMMQDQIKSLKIQLQNSEATQERDRLLILTESLHKEVQLSGKKIEQQTRIIHFLNEKLSQFEIQNIEIIKKVDLLQSKLSQMEIDSILQKKRVCSNCSNRPKQKTQDAYSNVSRSRQRRNGSIQNVKKTQRDEAGLELERYQP